MENELSKKKMGKPKVLPKLYQKEPNIITQKLLEELYNEGADPNHEFYQIIYETHFYFDQKKLWNKNIKIDIKKDYKVLTKII